MRKSKKRKDQRESPKFGRARRKFLQWVGQVTLYLAAITTIAANVKQLLPQAPPNTAQIPPSAPIPHTIIPRSGALIVQGGTATLAAANATATQTNAQSIAR